MLFRLVLRYSSEGGESSQQSVDSTPRWLYAICSLTYLGAMIASNEALQHVSYPTQVLGKSIKPVPVMILGVLISRKRYPILKYICVLMIVVGKSIESQRTGLHFRVYSLLGVALFMHKDKKSPTKASESDALLESHPFALVGFGELLLMISLALDGFTGAIQDRMNSHHTTKTHAMMYNINIWSCLWLFVGK